MIAVPGKRRGYWICLHCDCDDDDDDDDGGDGGGGYCS